MFHSNLFDSNLPTKNILFKFPSKTSNKKPQQNTPFKYPSQTLHSYLQPKLIPTAPHHSNLFIKTPHSITILLKPRPHTIKRDFVKFHNQILHSNPYSKLILSKSTSTIFIVNEWNERAIRAWKAKGQQNTLIKPFCWNLILTAHFIPNPILITIQTFQHIFWLLSYLEIISLHFIYLDFSKSNVWVKFFIGNPLSKSF
jgi:hypothetical protein